MTERNEAAGPPPATVTIHVNGDAYSVAAGTTVARLLAQLDVATVGVAVELNREVVRRSDHPTRELGDGDRVEIVRFVGGG